MDADNQDRLSDRPAAALCQDVVLNPKAEKLRTPEMKAGAFLALLTEKEFFPEAVRLRVRTLPPRDAVWWACLCVRHAAPAEVSPAELDAVRAVVRWIQEPTAEQRPALQEAAEALGTETPIGALANAAFMAGSKNPVRGSKAAAAAVFFAAARAPGGSSPRMYREFLAMGNDVERNAPHWVEPQRSR